MGNGVGKWEMGGKWGQPPFLPKKVTVIVSTAGVAAAAVLAGGAALGALQYLAALAILAAIVLAAGLLYRRRAGDESAIRS